MRFAKVAITLEKDLLTQLDRLVAERHYSNRSQAIQAAVRDNLERFRRRPLPEEATKLDRKEERALAEEGFAAWLETWPA